MTSPRPEITPWPGRIFVSGPAMPARTPSESMVPDSVPPLPRSMTGNATVRNMSPVWMTSESTKWMMLSPSVCPGGIGMTCTSSPLRWMVTSSL